jgi:CBS-domain-containing membrane protein
MQAADIMTTNLATVAEDATAGDAAQLMLQHRISALPGGGTIAGGSLEL